MSYKTVADNLLENAKEDIESATRNLSEIIVNKVSGHDEFSKAYKDSMIKAFYMLIEISGMLNV